MDGKPIDLVSTSAESILTLEICELIHFGFLF